MWYEILPSLGLVYVFVAIPPYASWALNKLTNNGKSTARHWENNVQDFHLYMRDQRITGSEYVPRGLEAIVDEKKE